MRIVINMKPKPENAREFMRRYPRVTAHIISESLGYATPTTAAMIGLDGMKGKENYCEWIWACYGKDAREALQNSIERRHYHKGYMSWYKEGALPLVRHAIEIEEENDDLKPGYYFSTLTLNEVWEKLWETSRLNVRSLIYSFLPTGWAVGRYRPYVEHGLSGGLMDLWKYKKNILHLCCECDTMGL
jgi:hypothetical protein